MKRVIILLFDSLGIGTAHDSASYNDKGANTLGHIIEQFPNIKIPNLHSLGLIHALEASTGKSYKFPKITPLSFYGFGVETSKGKDTPSGHWELMGCPVDFDWGYFKKPTNSFPEELLNTIATQANLTGFLGNCIASGTEIIIRLGEESMKKNLPIVYTSADSVFQIAAHENTFGLDNLYKLCTIAREELYAYNIGRVIARPFIGTSKDNFKRTGNRKDYSIAPHLPTVLNKMQNKQGEVIAIGKISDIFAGSGISKSVKATGLENLLDTTLEQMKENKKFSIIFTNLVDFDSEYGHRRDVKGYCEALEYVDSRLPELLQELTKEDLLVITADHGCDPSWQGTDHTREHVPILFYNKKFVTKNIGKRNTFADVGQSIANYLQLEKLQFGTSFLNDK
ncbi:Phosphopentomutase [Candidatus Hepatincola sp. Pdp]